MLYYGEHVGSNPHKREKYREHIYFQDCSDFCELWDQKSFDPTYNTKSVYFFAPIVEEVFARKPYDPKYIKHSKREPLVKIIN